MFLGLIVTAAHTAGVYLLGAITVGASKYIVPDQLYPWLEMVSGIIIVVFASYLMIRAWTGEDGRSQSKQSGSPQPLVHALTRRGAPRSSKPRKKSHLTQLLTLGITGGMVPCPAALVVLLGAFSCIASALVFFSSSAFSLGLAAVLVAIGLFMVYAKEFVARWKS